MKASRSTYAESEQPFRAVGALLLLSAFAISGYHRRKARQSDPSVEAAAVEEEGVHLFVALRVAGFTMWGSVALYLLRPRWMRWAQLPLPRRLRWLGALLAALTVPLFQWMFRSIGTNISPTVAIRREHQLVVKGPYRWVRHPLYSLGTLFVLSLALLAANWFIALAGAIAFPILMARLPKEEEKLLERFGDEYREYMARTGRLFPRFRR